MGEETRNPKMAVPRSVFWALVGNMTLGFIMLVTFIVSEMLCLQLVLIAAPLEVDLTTK